MPTAITYAVAGTDRLPVRREPDGEKAGKKAGGRPSGAFEPKATRVYEALTRLWAETGGTP